MLGGMEVGNPALAAPGSKRFTNAGSRLARGTDGQKRTLSQEEADDFCLKYRPLVGSIAGKYCNRGIAFDELRSAGLVGLVLATKKFDPDRGVAFGGYAKYWIRGQILELFKPKGDALGLGRVTSLNDPAWTAVDGEGNQKQDLIIDGGAPTITVDLSSLNERERVIFDARSEGRTLDGIGKDLGVSRERVRQLNERVLEKVKNTPGNAARHAIRELFSRHQVDQKVLATGRSCHGFVDREPPKHVLREPQASRELVHHRTHAAKLAAERGGEPLRSECNPYACGGPVIHGWGR